MNILEKLRKIFSYKILLLLLLAIAVAAGLNFLGLALHLGTVDDAFITFRCSKNLAKGYGLVYNPGEHVESTTSFLFAVIVGLAYKITKISPEFIGRVMNFIGVGSILFLLGLHSIKKQPPATYSALRFTGFLFFALHPATIIFAHSGLETIFFTALLFCGFVFLNEHLENGWPAFLSGMMIGLAADVRMEAAAFGGLAVVLAYFLGKKESRLKNSLLLALAFAVFFIPVLAYRWQYYGYPFPNSYYVKVDGGSYELALRGARYSVTWLLTNPIVMFSMLYGLWICLQDRTLIRTRSILGFTWAGAYLVYNVFVGGDYFYFSRFFVPSIPILGWMLSDQLPRLAEVMKRRDSWSAAIVYSVAFPALILSLACPIILTQSLSKYREEMSRVQSWKKIGQTLKKKIESSPTLYLAPAGAIPYFSGFRAYDTLGLTDPAVSHKKRKLGVGMPGHEKTDYSRFRDIKPDMFFWFEVSKDTNVLLTRYTKVIEKIHANPNHADDECLKSVEFDVLENWKSTLCLLTSHALLDEYNLMELKEPSVRGLFFVRNDLNVEVQRAFKDFRAIKK